MNELIARGKRDEAVTYFMRTVGVPGLDAAHSGWVWRGSGAPTAAGRERTGSRGWRGCSERGRERRKWLKRKKCEWAFAAGSLSLVMSLLGDTPALRTRKMATPPAAITTLPS